MLLFWPVSLFISSNLILLNLNIVMLGKQGVIHSVSEETLTGVLLGGNYY